MQKQEFVKGILLSQQAGEAISMFVWIAAWVGPFAAASVYCRISSLVSLQVKTCVRECVCVWEEKHRCDAMAKSG